MLVKRVFIYLYVYLINVYGGFSTYWYVLGVREVVENNLDCRVDFVF